MTPPPSRGPAHDHTTASQIRVVVADDHPAVRSGLVALLSSAPDITVVAEAADGDSALAAARAHRPDVVLTDVRMPGATGIEITPRLRETGANVLVISGFDLDDYVLGALAAGADGYLVKSEDPQRILAAVRDVHRGDAVLSAAATRAVVGALRERGVDAGAQAGGGSPVAARGSGGVRAEGAGGAGAGGSGGAGAGGSGGAGAGARAGDGGGDLQDVPAGTPGAPRAGSRPDSSTGSDSPAVVPENPGRAPAGPAPTFTGREEDVLALVAQGMTNQQIASALFVEITTVKSHLSHALTKLQLDSRVQAALWWQQHRG